VSFTANFLGSSDAFVEEYYKESLATELRLSPASIDVDYSSSTGGRRLQSSQPTFRVETTLTAESPTIARSLKGQLEGYGSATAFGAAVGFAILDYVEPPALGVTVIYSSPSSPPTAPPSPSSPNVTLVNSQPTGAAQESTGGDGSTTGIIVGVVASAMVVVVAAVVSAIIVRRRRATSTIVKAVAVVANPDAVSTTSTMQEPGVGAGVEMDESKI